MSVLKKDLFARIPEGHPEEVKKLLADEMKDFHKKSSFSTMIRRGYKRLTAFMYIPIGLRKALPTVLQKIIRYSLS